MSKNILFSFKKVTKTYYLGQPRGGGGRGASAPSCPPLRTAMIDALM